MGGCRQGSATRADFIDDPVPGVRKGWQRGVAVHVDEAFLTGVVWPDGRRTIQLHPIVQCDSVRNQEFRVLLLRRLVPSAPVRVKLPGPSTRSKWTPPRSLSACKSFGAKGVPLRERCSTRLQRGQGESDYERAGFGPASQSWSRQSPIGSGG